MHGKVFERPQQMLMRVAIGIHKHDLEAAIETCAPLCSPAPIPDLIVVPVSDFAARPAWAPLSSRARAHPAPEPRRCHTLTCSLSSLLLAWGPCCAFRYHLMSDKWFTHATPTMFNAGTPTPQMSSCFLLSMKEDSIDGIFETLKLCAQISKSAVSD